MESTLTPSDDGGYIVIDASDDGGRVAALQLAGAGCHKGKEPGTRCPSTDVAKSRPVENPASNLRQTPEEIMHLDPPDSPAHWQVPVDSPYNFYPLSARRWELDLFSDLDQAIAHREDGDLPPRYHGLGPGSTRARAVGLRLNRPGETCITQ